MTTKIISVLLSLCIMCGCSKPPSKNLVEDRLKNTSVETGNKDTGDDCNCECNSEECVCDCKDEVLLYKPDIAPQQPSSEFEWKWYHTAIAIGVVIVLVLVTANKCAKYRYGEKADAEHERYCEWCMYKRDEIKAKQKKFTLPPLERGLENVILNNDEHLINNVCTYVNLHVNPDAQPPPNSVVVVPITATVEDVPDEKRYYWDN